jgi:hypothetical protein
MNSYPELKWVVMCRWPSKAYWEPIAAFNVETAAISYKESCENVNGDFLKYKIEEIVDESLI